MRGLVTLFSFYKNIVFPAQDEFSYFSADVRLQNILVNILRLHLYPCPLCCVPSYVLHVPFIELSVASNIWLVQVVLSFSWLVSVVLPLRERKNFIRSS